MIPFVNLSKQKRNYSAKFFYFLFDTLFIANFLFLSVQGILMYCHASDGNGIFPNLNKL